MAPNAAQDAFIASTIALEPLACTPKAVQEQNKPEETREGEVEISPSAGQLSAYGGEERVPSSSVALPSELLSLILSDEDLDKDDLAACALVCRNFSEVVQPLLYHSIRLSLALHDMCYDGQVTHHPNNYRLVHALEKPALANLVCKLRISVEDYTWEPIRDELPMVNELRRLFRMEESEYGFDEGPDAGQVVAEVDRQIQEPGIFLAAFLPRFQSLEYLFIKLGDLGDSAHNDLSRMWETLARLPRLSHLRLNTRFDDDYAPYVLDSSTPFSSLRRILLEPADVTSDDFYQPCPPPDELFELAEECKVRGLELVVQVPTKWGWAKHDEDGVLTLEDPEAEAEDEDSDASEGGGSEGE